MMSSLSPRSSALSKFEHIKLSDDRGFDRSQPKHLFSNAFYQGADFQLKTDEIAVKTYIDQNGTVAASEAAAGVHELLRVANEKGDKAVERYLDKEGVYRIAPGISAKQWLRGVHSVLTQHIAEKQIATTGGSRSPYNR